MLICLYKRYVKFWNISESLIFKRTTLYVGPSTWSNMLHSIWNLFLDNQFFFYVTVNLKLLKYEWLNHMLKFRLITTGVQRKNKIIIIARGKPLQKIPHGLKKNFMISYKDYKYFMNFIKIPRISWDCRGFLKISKDFLDNILDFSEVSQYKTNSKVPKN